MKIDRYEWDELTAGLSSAQLRLLEACAEETGLPSNAWTAVPGLTTLAVTWATVRLAGELTGSLSARLDTAEGLLVRDEIADRREYAPNTVRQNLARWRRAVRGP